MPTPKASSRFFTSPGLTPDAVTRMRTSPARGCGSGISPTIRTSRAGPCLSYHAAFMIFALLPKIESRDCGLYASGWSRLIAGVTSPLHKLSGHLKCKPEFPHRLNELRPKQTHLLMHRL